MDQWQQNEKILAQGIQLLGLNLSTQIQNQLIQFIKILHKWNKAYNLTSVREPQEMVTRHILDSLTLVPYLKGQRIIDVGTGGGFPGIPLALAFPEQQFVLLDSNGKKIRFLIQAIADMKLNNVEAMQSRVEDYEPKQCFDTVVVRAFATIDDIIAKTSHLCCPNGQILMMKGAYPTEELAAIAKNVSEIQVYPLEIPGLKEERHLVIKRNTKT